MSYIEPNASDVLILKIANTEKRIVVTMNKDFGNLVYIQKMSTVGVLLLRLEDANGTEKAQIIKLILEKYANMLHGAFSVFKNEKLRIRPL